MLPILSSFFKGSSGVVPPSAPILRWLPVEYNDKGLAEGRPATVRFKAFDERELVRAHPRVLDNYGDVSMTLDAVMAVAAKVPAPAHAEVPADVARAALQMVLTRSREPVSRFTAGHALATDAARAAFMKDCAARGVALSDPGPRAELVPVLQ